MRTGKDIGIITAGLLVASMLLFGCPVWLHGDKWTISLVHHFFHANIFHLAVNCYSFYLLCKSRNVTPSMLLLAYVCATLSWFCSNADPVGASNIIFALLGLYTPALSNAWWKAPGTIVFFTTNMAMALLPQVSAVTHLVSFGLGCVCAMGIRMFNSLLDDFRRATYHR